MDTTAAGPGKITTSYLTYVINHAIIAIGDADASLLHIFVLTFFKGGSSN